VKKLLARIDDYVITYKEYPALYLRLHLQDYQGDFQVGGHDNFEQMVRAICQSTDTECSLGWRGALIGVVQSKEGTISHFFPPMRTEEVLLIDPTQSLSVDVETYCERNPTHPSCEPAKNSPIDFKD